MKRNENKSSKDVTHIVCYPFCCFLIRIENSAYYKYDCSIKNSIIIELIK